MTIATSTKVKISNNGKEEAVNSTTMKDFVRLRSLEQKTKRMMG